MYPFGVIGVAPRYIPAGAVIELAGFRLGCTSTPGPTGIRETQGRGPGNRIQGHSSRGGSESERIRGLKDLSRGGPESRTFPSKVTQGTVIVFQLTLNTCVCSVYYQPNSSRLGGPLSRPPAGCALVCVLSLIIVCIVKTLNRYGVCVFITAGPTVYLITFGSQVIWQYKMDLFPLAVLGSRNYFVWQNWGGPSTSFGVFANP